MVELTRIDGTVIAGSETGTIRELTERHTANLRGANLRGANLWDANLRGANLWGANLWNANLRGANLRDADLWGANLRDADLRGANLWGANLWGADLWGANLQGANLWDANLRDANLRDADLRGANLRGADLRGANLRGADLRGAEIDGVSDMRLFMVQHAGITFDGTHYIGYRTTYKDGSGRYTEGFTQVEGEYFEVDLPESGSGTCCKGIHIANAHTAITYFGYNPDFQLWRVRVLPDDILDCDGEKARIRGGIFEKCEVPF